MCDKKNNLYQKWEAAIVDKNSHVPKFGENLPYNIRQFLDLTDLKNDNDMILHTLPLPLPCNNYNMAFAPEQINDPFSIKRNSLPFHEAYIPDVRPSDGRKVVAPITLKQWIQAKGDLLVTISKDSKSAAFEFCFKGLIPNSLYTIMALREHDLDPNSITRPGPLGVPNVFIADKNGAANYSAVMPNPFENNKDKNKRNRIINVIVLWMSSQMSYGGAIGHYGLGGDIHAQLKFKKLSFMDLGTRA